ncbi:MAG TPA: winged helix-turn-helix domain-containing protein [Burkholderiales bacterium]|nr:winged helix-turn-helix domain-containing protein [Burkholderiales bacterium]
MHSRRSLRRLNIAELAEVSGLSPSTVSARLNRSGLAPAAVVGTRKVYDAPAALRYLLAGEDLDPQRERARLDRARAESQELELSRQRGALVPAESLDSTLIALATVAAGHLQALGSRLAVPLAAAGGDRARCLRLVDDAVAEALTELADRAATAQQRLALASSAAG